MSLADMKCVPCRGGTPPMERKRAEQLLRDLSPGWQLNQEGHLDRTYPFKDFVQALEFANKVGAIAETEGHHPDLHIAWGNAGSRSGPTRSRGSPRATSTSPPRPTAPTR